MTRLRSEITRLQPVRQRERTNTSLRLLDSRTALGRERTEVQREQLRTGWSISVHPTIGRDEVTVRLSLARRSLVEERPFQFGESVGTNFVTDDQVSRDDRIPRRR